ncbi:MAG: putative transporter ATP-binding protein, partial [Friedmanniella sp.]|nr:putative transporter ATP-binding protein [Friedmanniella sp.]
MPSRRPARVAVLGALAALVLPGLAVVGVASPLAPTAARAAAPVTETPVRVAGTPEPDGRPVDLDVSLFTTSPATAQPAVVLAHGFGGTKADSAQTGRSLARSGYTVITYTARGFGTSGGRIHLNDPA